MSKTTLDEIMTQCLVCSHLHTSTCGCCDESDYYDENR